MILCLEELIGGIRYQVGAKDQVKGHEEHHETAQSYDGDFPEFYPL
jgi:hypothetical protein